MAIWECTATPSVKIVAISSQRREDPFVSTVAGYWPLRRRIVLCGRNGDRHSGRSGGLAGRSSRFVRPLSSDFSRCGPTHEPASRRHAAVTLTYTAPKRSSSPAVPSLPSLVAGVSASLPEQRPPYASPSTTNGQTDP